MKKCSICNRELNRPPEEAEIEKLKMGGALGIGKEIYHAMLNKKLRSIDLCNFCYSVMQGYRHTLSEDERVSLEKEQMNKTILGGNGLSNFNIIHIYIKSGILGLYHLYRTNI